MFYNTVTEIPLTIYKVHPVKRMDG